jgi:Ca2+-binding RTX toxin-like protein
MSYFDAENTGANWYASNGNWYYPQTPMLHDVLAIQAMYGADMATRAGDTVYGFNSSADQTVFDFTINPHPVLTIWDGGGVDTLDLSGFQTASAVNLTPGTFSNCDAMTGNIAIAFGAWIENATCGAGNDTLTGNDLANVLIGNGGNDTLSGGAGNDILNGGIGSDILLGGGGDDMFYFDAADNLAMLDGGSGFDTLVFADSFLFFDLAGHALEQSMVTMLDLGNEAWDEINDLHDIAGNRVRQDRFNDDGTTVVTDWDVYDQETWAVRVRTYDAQGVLTSEVLDGEDVPVGDGGDTGGEGPLNPTGTAGADTLLGDDSDNVFAGMGGNDTLTGLGGNDFLDGGSGADVLNGGSGNDTYIVDSTGDAVAEAPRGGVDAVQTSVTLTLAANVENLTLTGGSSINGTGNGLDNTILGNAASNTLNGGAGNDLLDGGLGSDTLNGGSGNDTYVINSSGDRVNESSRAGTDLVLSSVTHTLASSVENLTLTGTSSINGTGSSSSNVLSGNSAANTLRGESGNDTINGEAGRDVLTGGKGADRFVFDNVGDTTIGSSRDVISDFSRSQGDKISLAAIDADGNAANGDQSFVLVSSFSGTAGQLRYIGASKILAGDTNGDGVADFEIGLNVQSVQAGDFIL